MPIRVAISRHKLATTLAAIVLVPLVVLTLWAFITLSFTYSSGERAGFLQKVSKRGWICKTWEGEMQLSAIPGSAPQTFEFSTRSDSIAAELNKLAGQRVVITYEQHKAVPTRCFGDTEYYVTGVRTVSGP
jgi:hypothetical protein